jgi:putative spermidine/putrescine transport system ATP-binding protein
MAHLSLRGVRKSYGANEVLKPTELEVGEGEFLTLLGPSGCGKSTLLRIIMGIAESSGGEIELAGRRIESLPPERRDVAMVFQSYALFPHMTVGRNLMFGLRMKGVPGPEQERRLRHATDICNLGDLLGRMPRQLSGGQQQRVALARALVMQPALMLFDEPLSNLDAKLRDSLRDELVALHRRVGMTSLYVTHDQSEAMAMSDRIAVMNQGGIIECGTPMQLYRQPRRAFTATFLGHTNFLDLVVEDGFAALPWGGRCRVDGPPAGRRAVRVSVRPEHLAMEEDAAGAAEVVETSFGGPQVSYLVRAGELTLEVTRSGALPLLERGRRVALRVEEPLRPMDDPGAAP